VLTSKKDFFNRAFSGIGKALARLPIHPNVLTLLGLSLGVACCVYLLISRDLLVFSVLVLLAGLFDMLDGAMARASGKSSKFGSYLDAMTDRYFEVLVVISVAYVTGYWVLSSLLILGAYSVSYAKARAAMEIPIQNNEWPDFLERVERDIAFIASLFISQLFPIQILGHTIFWWTLVLLVLGTQFTVVQRILRARHFMETRDR